MDRPDSTERSHVVSTLHDVARVAGVSIKTVSNVVNEYPHVSAATRDRVLSAIAELDYRPNLSARGLRSGKTGVIGLAIPELAGRVAEPVVYDGETPDARIARRKQKWTPTEIVWR